ncbi:MAG: yihG [Gammaproteobacteria bacterium]|jgi:1-acyl-sn-glycerol-3-phosphate acyltransferase|nr:yihG [Gammaproteobacteria bacterium]
MLRKLIFCPLAIILELLMVFLLPFPVLILNGLSRIMPSEKLCKACLNASEASARFWATANHFILVQLLGVKVHIKGLGNIMPGKNYFVIANHQSWIDILMLEEALLGHSGFSRYFIKKNLLHVPLAGWTCRALNFPYMYRFTKEHLAKHPEDKGKDVEITKRACQQLRGIYFKLNNFPEGTRLTAEKHKRQQSPFQNLLKPKSGGISYALQILHDQLDSIIDMTIYYHQPAPNIVQLFLGKVQEVTIVLHKLPLSSDLIGDYQNDPNFRAYFHQYMNTLWTRKDQLLTQLKRQNSLSMRIGKK